MGTGQDNSVLGDSGKAWVRWEAPGSKLTPWRLLTSSAAETLSKLCRVLSSQMAMPSESCLLREV